MRSEEVMNEEELWVGEDWIWGMKWKESIVEFQWWVEKWEKEGEEKERIDIPLWTCSVISLKKCELGAIRAKKKRQFLSNYSITGNLWREREIVETESDWLVEMEMADR